MRLAVALLAALSAAGCMAARRSICQDFTMAGYIVGVQEGAKSCLSPGVYR